LKRDQTDLRSIDKFAEGGFNRIIKATFKDGFEILARLPFHMDAPLRHSVASEAATLTYLRAEGLPVPKVHGYSALSDNPVRTQYILLEKLEGRPLSDDWFSLPNKTLVKVMKQLVALEKKLLAIRLPASGSLYFSHDLPSESPGVSVLRLPQGEGEVVVGPSAAYAWWYRERAALETARGPCTFSRRAFDMFL
jgi:aminoglycoside phosphotransferase (APT) family kinase protein